MGASYGHQGGIPQPRYLTTRKPLAETVGHGVEHGGRSIARVLGDPGTAIETARRINPAATPLVERRARFWADVARSFHQWGKPAQCYRALLAAEKASPDEVRYRKPIQQITTDLLGQPTAASMPGLHAFATRTGALA